MGWSELERRIGSIRKILMCTLLVPFINHRKRQGIMQSSHPCSYTHCPGVSYELSSHYCHLLLQVNTLPLSSLHNEAPRFRIRDIIQRNFPIPILLIKLRSTREKK